MTILLDTNIFLWAAGIEKRLPEKAQQLFADPDSSLYFSSASSWEIAIKWSKGRLRLPLAPSLFIESVIGAAGLTKLSISVETAYAVADLPNGDHKDLFDRLLVAQAREHDMKLMTADAKLKQYDVDLILVQ